MAEAVAKTTLLGAHFPIVKAILKASTLVSLNTKFAGDNHYFEYDPLLLSRNFQGFPYIVIETEMDDEELVAEGDCESMNYTTNITIRMQHHAKGTSTEPLSLANLNAYADAILTYIKAHKNSILDNYKINHINIDGTPVDTYMMEGQKIAERQLVWTYNVILDTT